VGLRRRLKRSFGRFLVLGLVIVLLVLPNWLTRVPVLFFALMVWISFFKASYCMMENKTDREPCCIPVQGLLGTHRLHRRQKHDALWAMLGLKSPGARFRVTFARSVPQAHKTPVPDEVQPVLANSALSAAAAVATIGGFILSLVTFVFGRG
jgi:hypothetical protein